MTNKGSKAKSNTLSLFVAAALAVVTVFAASAQNYNLTKYNSAHGLPQNYVYSLAQDHNGFVWIAMTEGLTRFDGINFVNYTTRDSLSDIYVSKLIIDADGRLWCGHGNGQLTVWDGKAFHRVKVPETQAPIKDMTVDDRGNVWAVEQNKGIIKVSPDGKVTTYFDRDFFGRMNYFAIHAVNAFTMLIGTSEGLKMVKFKTDGTPESAEIIEPLSYVNVACINPAQARDTYWVGTDDGSIYRYNIVDGVERISKCEASCALEGTAPLPQVCHVHEDAQGTLYIATWGAGLLEWQYSTEKQSYIQTQQINEQNGMGCNYLSDILVDREGLYWFATYGAGVVAWINNYFAQYSLVDIGFQRYKAGATVVHGNDIWVGLNNGLLRLDRECVGAFDYFDSQHDLPQGACVTALAVDSITNTLYVGTDNKGIYYRQNGNRYFQRLNYNVISGTNNMINDIEVDNNNIYVATQGGFIVYDKKQGTSHIYTTNDGLPHNNINFLYIDDMGQVWLGPKDSGVAIYGEEGFEIQRLSDQAVNITAVAKDGFERMWFATATNGVICSNNDSIVALTTNEGLEKNYCYDMTVDGEGRIWISHQPGLTCIDINTGNVRKFNNSNGVGQEFIQSYCDASGDLWFATTGGVVRYIHEADKRNNVPPIINLTKTTISGKRLNAGHPIDVGYPYFRQPDKFEFDFVGICMRDPMNVRYEYWLQSNGDTEERWMPLGTQNHKEFDILPEGDYVLNVRAINGDGMMGRNVLSIPIHVDYPFWKHWWFPVLVTALALLLLRWVVKWREGRFRERQQELEREVQRQTSMLQKQKNVIERKNRDIMDGINYAKRIQTAILQPEMTLKSFPLADSFLIFRPRDVVSGDLYWFNQSDNHVLICCGDCTGHGVPGGFMSMIVTTILNETAPEERSPGKLLERLDRELKHTLNRNQSVESQDGMDCNLIDINLETLEMVSASARRPLVVQTRGKQEEIRGTRRSLGERRNGNEFTEARTQLYKGDTVYMFSDGFTDQFNPDEQKYTSGRLKRLLVEICELPLQEQGERLNAEFDSWKGEREQVDDVIVMGVRV